MSQLGSIVLDSTGRCWLGPMLATAKGWILWQPHCHTLSIGPRCSYIFDTWSDLISLTDWASDEVNTCGFGARSFLASSCPVGRLHSLIQLVGRSWTFREMKDHTSSPLRHQDTTSAMCLHQGLEPKKSTTSPHLQAAPWWPRFHWCRRKPKQKHNSCAYTIEIPLQSRFKDPDVLWWCWFLCFYQAFVSCFSMFFLCAIFVISSLSTLRLRVFQFAGLVQRNLPHLWRHLREDMMPIWNGWLNIVNNLYRYSYLLSKLSVLKWFWSEFKCQQTFYHSSAGWTFAGDFRASMCQGPSYEIWQGGVCVSGVHSSSSCPHLFSRTIETLATNLTGSRCWRFSPTAWGVGLNGAVVCSRLNSPRSWSAQLPECGKAWLVGTCLRCFLLAWMEGLRDRPVDDGIEALHLKHFTALQRLSMFYRQCFG